MGIVVPRSPLLRPPLIDVNSTSPPLELSPSIESITSLPSPACRPMTASARLLSVFSYTEQMSSSIAKLGTSVQLPDALARLRLLWSSVRHTSMSSLQLLFLTCQVARVSNRNLVNGRVPHIIVTASTSSLASLRTIANPVLVACGRVQLSSSLPPLPRVFLSYALGPCVFGEQTARPRHCADERLRIPSRSPLLPGLGMGGRL